MCFAIQSQYCFCNAIRVDIASSTHSGYHGLSLLAFNHTTLHSPQTPMKKYILHSNRYRSCIRLLLSIQIESKTGKKYSSTLSELAAEINVLMRALIRNVCSPHGFNLTVTMSTCIRHPTTLNIPLRIIVSLSVCHRP